MKTETGFLKYHTPRNITIINPNTRKYIGQEDIKTNITNNNKFRYNSRNLTISNKFYKNAQESMRKTQKYYLKNEKSPNNFNFNTNIKTLSTNKKTNKKNTNTNFYLSHNNYYNAKAINNKLTTDNTDISPILPKINNSNQLDDNKNNSLNTYTPINTYNSNASINLKSNTKLSPPKKLKLYTEKNAAKIENNKKNLKKIDNKILLDDILNFKCNFYPNPKCSEKSFDLITAYGVNTYKGMIRNYNEDRISVIVNAKKNNKDSYREKKWPKISFFGIYDGHGGSKCCDYLKTHLHNYIFESEYFPNDPIKAIEQGFKYCENSFINSIHFENNLKTKNNKEYTDFSGSCAIIILIIEDICYTINLGDSRAIYSYDSGKKFYQLSRDQKPNDRIEKDRIYNGGGSIFKANVKQFGVVKESELGFKIPFRILPGRLSVSIIL